MKLEVGKEYIAKNGNKSVVVRDEGDGEDCFAVDHDGIEIWHFVDGRANIGGVYDLVSEVSPPPKHPDPDRYIRILEAMLTYEQVKTANRIMGVM